MKKGLLLLAITIYCVSIVVGLASAATTEVKKFGLNDIPEISNKTAINTIVETGATFD